MEWPLQWTGTSCSVYTITMLQCTIWVDSMFEVFEQMTCTMFTEDGQTVCSVDNGDRC